MFDLAAGEIAGLLRGATTPSSAEVGARFAERQRWCGLEPPLFLGAPPADPPIDVLPGAMATMMRVTLAVTALLEADERRRRPGRARASEPSRTPAPPASWSTPTTRSTGSSPAT